MLGETFHVLGAYQAPSALNPAICISKYDANSDITISSSNYPLLVPYLREITYIENASYSSSFTTSAVSSVNGTSTITFASNTANNTMIAAYDEEMKYDNSVRGGTVDTTDFTNGKFTINVSGVDYVITALNTSTRVFSLNTPSGLGSSNAAQTCIIYPFRIAGSSTTAFIRKLKDGSTLLSGIGMRARGIQQSHKHAVAALLSANISAMGTGANSATSNSLDSGVPKTDGTNGTPRVGSDTQGHGMQSLIYLYAGTYIA